MTATRSRPAPLPRVLFVCHNHPSFHPGGTEIFAHDLFRHMKDVDGIEAMFLACTNKVHREQKPGTNFQTVGRSSDELVLWAGHFDRFYQSQIDLHGIVPDLSTLLQSFRPDIVHIHHTLLLGVEMLFLIRRVVPQARIVYTLHDYYPICANDGQMVTTDGHKLCTGASPDACHRCFPERTPDKFVLREKHLKSMLSLVDQFISPSHFLRERYIAWGLPADRIAVLRNGRPAEDMIAKPTVPMAVRSKKAARRNVFGYFGNLSPYKGIRVALEAAKELSKDQDFVLHVHGGMPFQTDEFKAEIEALSTAAGAKVIRHGAYRRDEMAKLLGAVDWVITPSIWWENAPLVIQEAFQQRRPVICSDIGGMAEAVTNGHDGLHFRTGDPADLARAMRRAINETGLWECLSSNIARVPTLADSAAEHRALYTDLTTAASLREFQTMTKTVNEINPKADIQIAVLVDEKTLLLFGWIDRALPSSGTASFSEGADAAGTYDGHFWPRDEGSYWFVALLRFDNIAQIRPQRLSITGSDRGTRYTIPPIQNIKINPWTLLSTLKEDMPEALPVVFDFLHKSLGETAQSERTTRLMLAFLQAMAQPDGFAEIFGCMTGLGALVQGWSFNLTAGEHDLLIETDVCRSFTSIIGSFERSDLPSTARGVLGVMTGADTLDLTRIRRIYYKAAKGWCYLEIFENRTLLNDQSAVPHLRAMLPTLTGEPSVLRTLKRLSNAQYEGFETVSRLEVPVRVGLDTAVRVPGAGTLVTGWVLDPDHHVSAITLKGIGVSARIDLDWCRTNRRDVSEAFAKDAPFAGKIVQGQDAHGFLAFVPESPEAPEQCERYLELSLSDDACAFMPVATSKAGTPALRRLLSTINLNDPASETIISRHIGPLVQAAGSAAASAEPSATVYTMGKALMAPRVSVVIPIADGRDDIDVTLAKLAVDRDFHGTEIVIASGAGAHERLSPSLRRFAEFYNLSIKLVPCPQAHDIYQAMDAGVRHASSDMLLLLSPSVLPTSTGWLSDLEWAYKTSGKTGMVSPTLLYEDFSIRFAGIQQISAQSAVSQYAGYSRDWLKGRELTTVQAASTDCALLPRAAFLGAGGFSTDFVGTDFKGVDFCLKLRAAGHVCLWLPTVQLIALDEQPREQAQEYWLQTGGLVDRWGFERKWPRLHTTQSLGSIDR